MTWLKANTGLIQHTEWDSGATLWDEDIDASFEYTAWDGSERTESWSEQAAGTSNWTKQSPGTSNWTKQ